MNKVLLTAVNAAHSAISRGSVVDALKLLREVVSPEDDFITQWKISKILKPIAVESMGLRRVRIAFLASTTLDHFVDIFRYWLSQEGFAADIWIAPNDTIVQTVLFENSELYSFDPDIVWIFTTHRDVRFELPYGDSQSVNDAINAVLGSNQTLWKKLQGKLSCVVIQNNADLPASDPFGNFAGTPAWTRRNLLRKYNLDLGAAAPPGIMIFDLDHLASNFGRANWVDWRYWYHSKHAFNFEAYGTFAYQAARLIAGIQGEAKKCLVLDLDNTLWGGVIGDDGLNGIRLGNEADGEAFIDFQKYLQSLQRRGIVLTVCSKNEEETAKTPFLSHPDMILKLEDITVFRANWANKVDNIRDIARTLNIGLDSMVFLDDNPVERDLVRKYLPEVATPEMPSDPSEYIQTLDRHCYFETIGFVAEDAERPSYYRDNAMRAELVSQFTDIGEYLNTLEMKARKGRLDEFHLPRAAQLIKKSNQFHLTGARYSEAELWSIGNKPNWSIHYFKLRDKFGDNGLISVVILNATQDNELLIDTWVMSCRVLGRTMEEFICVSTIEFAEAIGTTALVGRYVPSDKNKLVSSLYHRLGFSLVSEDSGTTTWKLDLLNSNNNLETWVK